ncbi:MAG TPA: AarF/UbiB family protein [Bryobacteraceae bacterium]|jgi:ubiquinone biosynthesis protein|nr:AarF/UbiB family protein [Bryobacteraceae bacterium]
MDLTVLRSFAGSHTPGDARTAAVKTALQSPTGGMLREELGSWVIQLLPPESVVPEIYAEWRPLVRDAMLFMIAHLSAARLAPKLVEQIDLPLDTTPEARLLRLIAKVPGLQKIGQVLARNRHLDPALRDALSELENGIRDVSPEEIGALIRKQLGRRLETHAVEIEPDMLAEASVSAVVRFTWWNAANGERERGVFKVLKPYVAACFAEDLELLQQLAHFLADKHPEYGRALPETILEVRRLLEHEVDFVREQATLVEAARFYKRMCGVRVPRLIKPLSTAGITALSEEEGVKVTAALAGASGRQRRRAAEQLIEALIAAPLFARGERSVFHADPHAGNLLYDQRTGELVLLDWALTESLTREQRRHIAILALMLGLRDPVGVCGEIEALTVGRRLSQEHRGFMQDLVNRFIGELSFSRLPSSMDAMRLLDRLALEGVRFPAGLMMFRKMLFTLDGILHDIAAPHLRMDLILARQMLARSPLSLIDWIGVEASALLYGGRVWVQWAQAALSRAGG